MNADQRFSCTPDASAGSAPAWPQQPSDGGPEDWDPSVPASLADGEARAWDHFFDAHTRLLLYWSSRRGVAPQDREDFLQRVYVRVIERVRRFKPNGLAGSFRGWLAKVAASVLADESRRAGRWPELRLPHALPQPPAPEEADSALVAWVQARVEVEFGPQSWIIYRRLDMQKDPAAAIAAELGMTEVAVRQRAWRVRHFLPTLREEVEHLQKLNFR
jgi:RNA polymerase sigma factor (sigma-70 family)